MPRAAIFVALPEELSYCVEVLERYGSFISDIHDMDVGQVRFLYEFQGLSRAMNSEVEIYLISSMGNVSSSSFVPLSFVTNVAPAEVFFLVGISGSLDATTANIGDVVVSNHVKYYTPDKVYSKQGVEAHKKKTVRAISEADRKAHAVAKQVDGKENEVVRPKFLGPDEIGVDERDFLPCGNFARFLRQTVIINDIANLIDRFMKSNLLSKEWWPLAETFGKHPPRVMRGALLGSNWVVDSDSLVEYLMDKNECQDFDYYFMNDPAEKRCVWNKHRLIAVDMESFGFMKTLEVMSNHLTKARGYAIRGISDLAAGKSLTDDEQGKRNRRVAASNAMLAALSMLEFYLNDSESRYPLNI
jgi:nucleoside phosphorylase